MIVRRDPAFWSSTLLIGWVMPGGCANDPTLAVENCDPTLRAAPVGALASAMPVV